MTLSINPFCFSIDFCDNRNHNILVYIFHKIRIFKIIKLIKLRSPFIRRRKALCQLLFPLGRKCTLLFALCFRILRFVGTFYALKAFELFLNVVLLVLVQLAFLVLKFSALELCIKYYQAFHWLLKSLLYLALLLHLLWLSTSFYKASILAWKCFHSLLIFYFLFSEVFLAFWWLYLLLFHVVVFNLSLFSRFFILWTSLEMTLQFSFQLLPSFDFFYLLIILRC